MSGTPARSGRPIVGLTFDTGALLGIERNTGRMRSLVELIHTEAIPVVIPANVLAQAWRDGSRQARMAHLLHDDLVDIVPLTAARARAVGVLCGRAGTTDVVDASVVLCAREYGYRTVVTSDPVDLARLDPTLTLREP